MPKYLVEIEETLVEKRTVEVTAENEDAAENEARRLYVEEASPRVSNPSVAVTARSFEAREIP